jgi:HD-GYP domain-containing protein (c-di-GMP phosphodiesterase class II)
VSEQHRPFRTPGVERDPEIPIESKIIKTASSYDKAVHEQRLSPVEALEQLHRGSAYDFDPSVTASLRKVLVHRGAVNY